MLRLVSGWLATGNPAFGDQLVLFRAGVCVSEDGTAGAKLPIVSKCASKLYKTCCVYL